MADFSYERLKSLNGVTPRAGADYLANTARKAVCGLYNLSPFALTGGSPGIDPFGVGKAINGFFDNMCDDQPLPSRLPPSPGGGQCPGTIYNIKASWKWFNFTGVTEHILPGPISPIQYRETPGNNYEAFYFYGTQTPRQIRPITNISQADGNRKANLSAIFTSITPVSGPDNCGQIAPVRPRTPLPPGGYAPVVPYDDGRGTRNLPVFIPPVTIPVSPFFQPQLVVKIDDVNIVFDLRGASILPLNIDIDAPITIGGGDDVVQNPNPSIPNPDRGLDPIAIADRFDRIEDLLKELEECACPEVQQLELSQFASNLQSFVNPQLPLKRNRYCAIAMTVIPSNAKRQDGLNSPDVLYAGWAWFLSPNGYASERMPIDAAGKVFKNPGNFSSFAFTLTQGYRANAFELNVPLTPP